MDPVAEVSPHATLLKVFEGFAEMVGEKRVRRDSITFCGSWPQLFGYRLVDASEKAMEWARGTVFVRQSGAGRRASSRLENGSEIANKSMELPLRWTATFRKVTLATESADKTVPGV